MEHVKMHDGELDIDEPLVRRLVTAQFPQWTGLPIHPVLPWGTDNAIFRLGDDLVLRLPRSGSSGGTQVEKESRWLPVLAPHLPLALPVPLEIGKPSDEYPWQWSVHRWLPGERATADRLADLCRTAVDLARFIKALQGVDPTDDAPRARRGGPLAPRDQEVRESVAALGDLVDADEVLAAWEAALRAPAWDGPPVWIHGDLTSGNLLAHDGHLSAVIDWSPGIGDPACETIAAWNLFSGKSREVFRTELGVDDATWARGRGWALSIALVALPYYLETYPGIVADSWRVLDEVLAEYRLGL